MKNYLSQCRWDYFYYTVLHKFRCFACNHEHTGKRMPVCSKLRQSTPGRLSKFVSRLDPLPLLSTSFKGIFDSLYNLSVPPRC